MIKKLKPLTLGFIILLAIQFFSTMLLKTLRIHFPAPLFGMIILSLLLFYKIIPEKLIKDISSLLLDSMALFFIPLFVGIVSYSTLLKENLMPIFATIILTTFITMVATAFFVELIINLTSKEKSE